MPSAHAQDLPLELHEMWLKELGLLDLLRVSATNQMLRRLARQVSIRKVREALGKWCGDVDGFLELLKKHGAIVSGSFVLHLLVNPEDWMAKDMDIYCAVGDDECPKVFLDDFCNFLAHQEPELISVKANLMSYPDQLNPPPGHAGAHAHTPGVIQSVHRIDCRNHVFEVIGVVRSPQATILQFSSTLVMNYLTYNEVVSLYPTFTQQGVGLISYSAVNQRSTRLSVLKYVKRGFCMTYHPHVGQIPKNVPHTIARSVSGWLHNAPHYQSFGGGPCDNQSICPRTERRMMDKWCAVMGLQSKGTTEGPYLPCWHREGFGCGDRCIGYAEGFSGL